MVPFESPLYCALTKRGREQRTEATGETVMRESFLERRDAIDGIAIANSATPAELSLRFLSSEIGHWSGILVSRAYSQAH
jgi:hypothetical protein